jgi:membrane-associated HD superfamily phosphohydrolase
MPVSELKLIKRCAEFLPRSQIKNIPHYRRGIYALLRRRPKLNAFDVVYIGIAAGTKTASIRGRLRTHEHRKGSLWTHFSIYEVWDNIREEEIRELEGIFRHIYRLDTRANRLNKQRSFKKLDRIRDNNLENWTE